MQLLDHFSGFMPWYEVEARVLVARAAIGLADSATARASLSRASRVTRRMSNASEFHTWLDDAWAEIDEHSASALSGAAIDSYGRPVVGVRVQAYQLEYTNGRPSLRSLVSNSTDDRGQYRPRLSNRI